jgi:hypothetical protein
VCVCVCVCVCVFVHGEEFTDRMQNPRPRLRGLGVDLEELIEVGEDDRILVYGVGGSMRLMRRVQEGIPRLRVVVGGVGITVGVDLVGEGEVCEGLGMPAHELGGGRYGVGEEGLYVGRSGRREPREVIDCERRWL